MQSVMTTVMTGDAHGHHGGPLTCWTGLMGGIAVSVWAYP
jgi:hypothetical protein